MLVGASPDGDQWCGIQPARDVTARFPRSVDERRSASRISLAQSFTQGAQVLALCERDQRRQMFGHSNVAQLAAAMNVQCLLHRLGAERGIGLAGSILDR